MADEVVRDQYGFTITQETKKESKESKDKKAKTRKDLWADIEQTLEQTGKVEVCTNLDDLVKQGIPPSLRGKIWLALTEAREKSESSYSYTHLLETFSNATSEYTIQIEKDLKRTFPNNEVFESDEGISALRRILVAYSWLNPEIGYCQSMNFIAALFLLFTDEEDAFWLMRETMERVLPADYYSPGMLGVRADERLFLEILANRLPKIYAHLMKYDINLSGFIVAWFMSLFINILPLEGALRVFDCLYYYGSTVLFRIGIAVFKMNEKAILKEKSFEDLYLFLKRFASLVEDFDKLINTAMSPSLLGSYKKKEKILLRRQFHWDELRRECIAELDRRGNNLHFPDETGELGAAEEEVAKWRAPTTPQQKRTDELSRSNHNILGSPRVVAKLEPSEQPRREVHEKHPPIPSPQRGRLQQRGRGERGKKMIYRGVPRNRTPLSGRSGGVTVQTVSAPPLPNRVHMKQLSRKLVSPIGPTRNPSSTSKVVDSRFEQRFRPLSVFFGNDLSDILPPIGPSPPRVMSPTKDRPTVPKREPRVPPTPPQRIAHSLPRLPPKKISTSKLVSTSKSYRDPSTNHISPDPHRSLPIKSSSSLGFRPMPPRRRNSPLGKSLPRFGDNGIQSLKYVPNSSGTRTIPLNIPPKSTSTSNVLYDHVIID